MGQKQGYCVGLLVTPAGLLSGSALFLLLCQVESTKKHPVCRFIGCLQLLRVLVVKRSVKFKDRHGRPARLMEARRGARGPAPLNLW